jgi:hypothetical protein
MMRHLVRPVVAVFIAAALTGVAAPAAFAAPTSAVHLSASCSGSVHTSVSATAVTVTGSATCTGLTTLALTTTTNTGGVLSSVTGLLPALPNVPLPISTTLPAIGVSSACSVLANAGTGATVSSSCSAG